MNQNPLSSQSKKAKKTIQRKNFLESLRDLGSGVVDSAAHDVVGGIGQQAINQLTGQNLPSKRLPQPRQPDQARQEYQGQERRYQHFRQEFLDIRHQERILWKRSEQETQIQITALVQELQQLSASTKNLTKEVAIAAQQVPVEPGIYHLSFFERLRRKLIALRKQIDQSATWLKAFNQKAKKRNYYWAQVRKSGTKFMLSQERYMATQAG